MHSVRLEPAKLSLAGMRVTYQATGDAVYTERLTVRCRVFYIVQRVHNGFLYGHVLQVGGFEPRVRQNCSPHTAVISWQHTARGLWYQHTRWHVRQGNSTWFQIAHDSRQAATHVAEDVWWPSSRHLSVVWRILTVIFQFTTSAPPASPTRQLPTPRTRGRRTAKRRIYAAVRRDISFYDIRCV